MIFLRKNINVLYKYEHLNIPNNINIIIIIYFNNINKQKNHRFPMRSGPKYQLSVKPRAACSGRARALKGFKFRQDGAGTLALPRHSATCHACPNRIKMIFLHVNNLISYLAGSSVSFKASSRQPFISNSVQCKKILVQTTAVDFRISTRNNLQKTYRDNKMNDPKAIPSNLPLL